MTQSDYTRVVAADPFTRKVYLRSLPGPAMPTRYSAGNRLRAGQLQRFLGSLQTVAERELTLELPELLVIGAKDWRRLFSRPYGLPFTCGRAGSVSVVAPADYPPRLLARWDDVLLRAAHSGLKPPGELREFLDLLTGHAWGRAALTSRLRGHAKSVALLADYLFLAALGEVDEALAARFVAWARLEAAGSAAGKRPTLRAAELLEHHGWRLLQDLAVRLEGGVDATEVLLELEPDLRPLLAGRPADA